METENSQNVFSVSITHNSKIRELSDVNRVMETELSCSQTDIELWVTLFLSYELWKLRIELQKQAIQTASNLFGNLCIPLRLQRIKAGFLISQVDTR